MRYIVFYACKLGNTFYLITIKQDGYYVASVKVVGSNTSIEAKPFGSRHDLTAGSHHDKEPGRTVCYIVRKSEA
jgi:hypothetical protein